MKQFIILNIIVFSIVFCLMFIGCDDDDEENPDDDNNDQPIDEDDFCNEKSSPNEAGETWIDSSSGLMWQKVPYNCELNWYDAFEYCDLLEGDGYLAWRIPTISELRSLIRGNPPTETGGSCGVTDDCLEESCRDESCKSNANCDGGCCWPSNIEGKCNDFNWSSSKVTMDSGGYDVQWVIAFSHAEIRMEPILKGIETPPSYTNMFVRCVHTVIE